MERGYFILSLDLELAWGSNDNKDKLKSNTNYFLKTREYTRALIKLMEKYNISATWAVVGHLFLSSCKPIGGIKHPEIIKPYNDWFDRDPCTSLVEDPIWYGNDMVEMIKKCKTPQEIGCHTFSHVLVSDPQCSQACFNSELALCKELANNTGISLKTFVFPRNKEKYVDSLPEYGFIAYRGKENYWYNKFPSILQGFSLVIDHYLFVKPPLCGPFKSNGNCWNIPGSYFLGHFAGFWKLLPMSFRTTKIKKGIVDAVQNKRIFHLWLHPCNIATDPCRMLKGLEDIFKYINDLRTTGSIENLTLASMVAELEKQQYATSLDHQRISR